MFPEIPPDWWQARLDEDLDNEDFDPLMFKNIPDGLSYHVWVELMTPLWIAQIQQMRQKGYLSGQT